MRAFAIGEAAIGEDGGLFEFLPSAEAPGRADLFSAPSSAQFIGPEVPRAEVFTDVDTAATSTQPARANAP
jgi:hypothetical protein